MKEQYLDYVQLYDDYRTATKTYFLLYMTSLNEKMKDREQNAEKYIIQKEKPASNMKNIPLDVTFDTQTDMESPFQSKFMSILTTRGDEPEEVAPFQEGKRR